MGGDAAAAEAARAHALDAATTIGAQWPRFEAARPACGERWRKTTRRNEALNDRPFHDLVDSTATSNSATAFGPTMPTR